MSTICIFVMALFLVAHGKIEQTPKPHPPLDPVVYPSDYCPDWDEKMEFDYVVVGAGPGGAPVARRLAEDPSVKVLILEAGADPPPISDIPTNQKLDLSVVWNIKTLPKNNVCQGYPGKVCTYAYVKYLGGASVTNLMMYTRGNHKDYNEWAKLGNPGWAFKDLKKYFLKLENFVDPRHQLRPDKGYTHTGGPFTNAPSQADPLTNEFQIKYNKALKKKKIPENNDPNGKRQNGFGEITASLEGDGYRDNVAKAYLLNIPNNLKICKCSIVQKLQIDESANPKKVTGVEFVYNGTKTMVAKAKREYILSAGPYSSPQILERSGVGRKDVLEKAGVDLVHELNGVGENLQEQFADIGCAFTLNLNNSVAPNPLSLATVTHTMFLNLSDYSQEVPEMQWIYSTLAPEQIPNFSPEIGAQYSAVLNSSRYLLLVSPIVLRQSNPGYIHIAGTDPNQSPLFQPNQYTTQAETKLLGDGCRLIREVMKDSLLDDFDPQPFILNECKEKKFNSDVEIMCGASYVSYQLYHMAGTTKMGPKSDPMAVVDSNLQVRGFCNLRVVDLGIGPLVTRANTEIPTIAVSEKAADLIKKGSKIECGK